MKIGLLLTINFRYQYFVNHCWFFNFCTMVLTDTFFKNILDILKYSNYSQ